MHRLCGKLACKPLGPLIRRQMHDPAARFQFMRQRLRWKHMPAGAAGAKESDLVHRYSAGTSIGVVRCGWILMLERGLARVSASTNPIEIAIATSDEPP